MAISTPNCAARNGTYVCDRAPGHIGPHETIGARGIDGALRLLRWGKTDPAVSARRFILP